MAPDLNSLPPSSSSQAQTTMASSIPGGSPAHGELASPSPLSATASLQAAATMNAGLQQERSRRTSTLPSHSTLKGILSDIYIGSSNNSLSRGQQSPLSGRRRTSVLLSLQQNDPSLPAPGEMVAEERSGRISHSPQPMTRSPLLTGGDPHHSRAPSLGELHQELEAEQEAQVNRLLQMIRQQQVELQRLQTSQGQTVSSVAAEDPLPERSSQVSVASTPRSPITPHHRSSMDLAREALHRRSRTPSRGAASPRLRASSISNEESIRDESAFYQAETSSLVRENQMLKHRIRELERQLSEATASSPLTPHEPAQPSHLQATTVAEDAVENVPKPES